MNLEHPFFIGIGGSGMSALARYFALAGKKVSGSDRAFDKESAKAIRNEFLSLGMGLFPQDGSGISPGITCVVHSTAVENSNPEIKKARLLNIPLLHRSEMLALLAGEKKSIAVAGTSGKSTVTAMVYEILKAGGLAPSLITGASLLSLTQKGLAGNASAGTGNWLVFEADESDGSITRYAPHTGLILNIEKDHKEIEELVPLFETFALQIRCRLIINKADDRCRRLGAQFAGKGEYSFSAGGVATPAGKLQLTQVNLQDWETRFQLGGCAFVLKVPGRYNLDNALAAVCTGLSLGISLENCAAGLTAYAGIERRHILVAQKKGITVIDDFAHNPAKVAACLETVKHMKTAAEGRIVAIFHPHGFGPMKLLQRDFVQAFHRALRQEDILLMPEIYYAGGTADKSISSRDIIQDLRKTGKKGKYFGDKRTLLDYLHKHLRSGDIVVNMGARDPQLGAFAENILSR